MSKTVKEVLQNHNIESNENLENDLKSLVNGIPQSRFSEVITERNNLKADISELNSKIKETDNVINQLNDITTERDEYKTKWDNHIEQINKDNLTKWNDLSTTLAVKEGESGYDKVQKIKSKFKFATNEIELTPEEVTSNINQYNTYSEIDYFNGINSDNKDNSNKDIPNNSNQSKKGKYYGYDTIQDLSGSSPDGWKKAKKWYEENGS